ncbi:hypothetical protein, partial [Methanobrevibacter sp.]|uniref:hypothetical protein n=1 Tax=Methanobrevibacter sp. TaxID=66852 RepID=UPI002E78FDAA
MSKLIKGDIILNRKMYLILSVLAIIGVLCCLNVCSAVEDNNTISIVSDNSNLVEESYLNKEISSDSVKMSQDEVNKELNIKPKYKVKTYSAVVDCPQIKTVKKLKKIIKSEIKDGYGNWRNYKIRNGIYQASQGDFYKLKIIKYGKINKKYKDHYVVKKFKGYKTVYKTLKGLYAGKITKNGVYKTNIVKKLYYKYGDAKVVKSYLKFKSDGIYGYANVKVPYKKVPIYKDVIKSKKVKFQAWR